MCFRIKNHWKEVKGGNISLHTQPGQSSVHSNSVLHIHLRMQSLIPPLSASVNHFCIPGLYPIWWLTGARPFTNQTHFGVCACILWNYTSIWMIHHQTDNIIIQTSLSCGISIHSQHWTGSCQTRRCVFLQLCITAYYIEGTEKGQYSWSEQLFSIYWINCSQHWTMYLFFWH